MKGSVWAVALAAVLVLSACAGKAKAGPEGVTEPSAETAAAESESPAAASQEELETAGEASAGGYQKGTGDSSGYESAWIGLKFTAPDGAVMRSEEELAERMGMSGELLSEDFSQQQLQYAQLSSVTEMMCAFADGMPNVNLVVEKLNASDISAEAYLTAVKQQLSAQSVVAYMPLSDGGTEWIGGQEFAELVMEADYNGVSLYQRYYVRIIDDRAVSIILTFTAEQADGADELMEAFSAYE